MVIPRCMQTFWVYPWLSRWHYLLTKEHCSAWQAKDIPNQEKKVIIKSSLTYVALLNSLFTVVGED